MKRSMWIAALFVAGGAMVMAQPPGGPGGRPPLIEVLDANHDGKISADEIKNATAALETLDRNRDGTLSEEEYRPPMPTGQGRPAGRPGTASASGRRPSEGPPAGRAGAPEGRPKAQPADGRVPPAEGADGSAAPNSERFVEHAMEFDADQDGKLDKEELKNFAAAIAELRTSGGPARSARRPASDAGAGSNLPDHSSTEANQAPLEFTGGYDTDPRDRGRPVVLIAAALGVPSEVFREVFTHVRPAGAGTEPDPEQVRRNKSALMDGLAKYGISNSRLDTVSNYYRYPPGRGERWRTTPASGYALIENGKVTRFVITNGGSGYTTPPSVSVKGLPGASGQAKLSFGKEFPTNGSISEITQPERPGE